MNNRQVILVSRPSGVAQAENFAIREAPVEPLAEGAVLVRNEFLSVEPAMRGWIADVGNYSAPVPIGSAMRALAVGAIAQSRHPGWREGDVVTGWFGWQEWAAVEPGAIVRRVAEAGLPHSLALGVLGINGVTALIGLTVVGEPRAGETVVVSTAAGAVGSAVGQIAKILGCRAVGIAGGPDKVAQCRDTFGYDAAIDYRAAGLAEALGAACPDGVNVYFDNTSGVISDAVHSAPRGRGAGRHLRHGLDPVLGAPGRPARASSGICWSKGPAPRASSSSTIATGGTLRWLSLRAGSGPDACATRRTSSTGSNPARTRSPVFIAARTRASG